MFDRGMCITSEYKHWHKYLLNSQEGIPEVAPNEEAVWERDSLADNWKRIYDGKVDGWEEKKP